MLLFITWFIIAVSFFLFELGSPGLLYCLSFSCGAALACIIAYIWQDDFFMQTISFFLGTIISYIGLYIWVQKDPHHDYKSNIDALKGKQGILVTAISLGNPGSVKIGGEFWMALSLHNQSIAAHTLVQVINTKGVHLIVTPVSHLT